MLSCSTARKQFVLHVYMEEKMKITVQGCLRGMMSCVGIGPDPVSPDFGQHVREIEEERRIARELQGCLQGKLADVMISISSIPVLSTPQRKILATARKAEEDYRQFIIRDYFDPDDVIRLYTKAVGAIAAMELVSERSVHVRLEG